MNSGIYKPNLNSRTGSSPCGPTDLQKCVKIIHAHKSEFEGYAQSGAKSMAVKVLKDYANLGLREAKEIMDLYFAGELMPNIKEERKAKLERLAKKPLVDELIVKVKKLTDEELYSLLMNLSIDELFSIDEFLPNEEQI